MWKQVVIDDYLPYLPNKNTNKKAIPVFTSTKEHEIWVMLLEKAYAKVHGSYYNIVGGDPSHALRDLTGAPYKRITELQNNDSEWDELLAYNNNNYLLTCYTNSSKITEEINKKNMLVSGHAYSILNVTTYNNERLLKIRNPWGTMEWCGDWGDKSSKWTEDAKRELNFEDKDDGIFWINYNDFCKNFLGIRVCILKENYYHNGVEIKGSSMAVTKLFVEERTHAFICLNQFDSRFYPSSHQYNVFRFYLAEITEYGLRYIQSGIYNDRNIFFEAELNPGQYLVLAQSYCLTDFQEDFTITTYSERVIEIENLEGNLSNYTQLEQLIWMGFYEANATKFDQINKINISDHEVIISSLKQDSEEFKNNSFVVFAFTNTGIKNCNLELYIDTKAAKMDYGNEINDGVCVLNIPVKETRVLLYKMNPVYSGSQNANFKFKAITDKIQSNEYQDVINNLFKIKKTYKEDVNYINKVNSEGCNCNVF